MPTGFYIHKKGRKCSEETKRKIGLANSIAKKGCIPWNKGFKGCYKLSNETKNKISETLKRKKIGIGKWMKGRNGQKHPNWKGGKIKTLKGYILIYKPKHPFCNNHRYVRRSRFIIEEYLGRYLKPKEIVHHKNCIKDDDRIENLMLFNKRGYHTAFHRWGIFKEYYITKIK